MKRLMVIVVLALISIFQVMWQPKPFIGYDKVAWGASVEEVRKAYNIGNDIVLEK